MMDGPSGVSALRLFDAHLHLDFYEDAIAQAHALDRLGVGCFANTVTPEGYRHMREAGLNGLGNVRLGVGLHPWWLADGCCGKDDIAEVERLLPEMASQADALFVGEVGMDFSPKRCDEAGRALQLEAFGRIVAASVSAHAVTGTPTIMSIHSVRSAESVLDLLEREGAIDTCACIFHWFSGTSAELGRARALGCWFSVNEFMLGTRRGREYARQIPVAQMLLETDLPEGEHSCDDAGKIANSLRLALASVAELKGMSADDLQRQLLANSIRLFG